MKVVKKVVKKAVSEIAARHKYVHGQKGKLENPHKKLKQWSPDAKLGKVSRIAGLGAIDLSWFLFCLGKYTAKDLHTLLWDNKLIDKMKDKHQGLKLKDSDFKFIHFFKKLKKNYPYAAARLKLWMLYGLIAFMSFGGPKNNQNDQQAEKTDATELVNKNRSISDIFAKNHIESMAEPDDMDEYVMYDVTDDNFKENFVNDNWESIIAGLLEFETYREKPKLHKGETRYTYGPGLTWVYVNGKQHPCMGKYKDMADNFSSDQVLDQVRQHCLRNGEVLDRMQTALIKNGITEISQEQALGLFFAGYQVPGQISSIVKRLKNAGNNEQKIIDSFMAGTEIKPLWRNGTNKRRWWCAMIYTGKVTIEDLLQMDRDAFAVVKINDIKQNNHFMFDDSTIVCATQQINPNTGTVQDFIDDNGLFDEWDTYMANTKSNNKDVFSHGIEKLRKKTKQRDEPLVAHADGRNGLS